MDRIKKPIEIRDSRRRQMYRVDDDYLNGYARLCGVAGTAVYNSLCRHADTNQESWPSIERIMDQHGISRSTAIRSLRKLEEWGIIAVKREKDPRTKRQMVNVYVLVDKSQWKPKPGVTTEPGAGCQKNTEPGVKNDKKPGVTTEPGAGCQKNTEPGVKNDKKPGVTTELEGYTEEKDTQRKGVAHATDPSPEPPKRKCQAEGCSKEPIKDRELCKQHQPMNCDEFVEWYRKSDKRYIRLIAEFADEVKPTYKTVAQWELWAAAHYRAAQDLEIFTDDQIEKGYTQVKASKYITEFNLYTVKKFILNTPNK